MGFEPTVGFPTLDFESSALNRTQPPFLVEERKRRTRLRQKLRRGKRRTPINREQVSNIATSNATVSEVRRSALGIGRLPAEPCAKAGLSVCNSASGLAIPDRLADRIFCLTRQKNVTIKGLPCLASLLHLVCPHGQPRYYLLLTGIHRFLAPLFTSIPSLFENINPSLTAMIQLKPGIPPASLNKPTHSAARRKNRMERKKNGGLRFKRVFSDAAVAPFDQIEWERRTAEITDDAGKVIFKQENVEVPKNWSLLATKVVVSKYFYGDANGTDRAGETSVRQLIHRVTRTIADWGIKDGYFAERKRGNFLRRADLAVPEPIRRVQFAGLVQRRVVSSVRRRQRRGRGKLVLQSQDGQGGTRGYAI